MSEIQRDYIESPRARALILGALIASSGCPDNASMKDDEKNFAQPKRATEPKKPTLPPTPQVDQSAYKEFKFPPAPGLYAKLTPDKTCETPVDQFKGLDVAKRFEFVINDCRGKLQGGGNTFLKITIPNHRVNGELVSKLDQAFDLEGDAKGLPQVAQRTFVFHREDGKDGLPGGNLINFDPVAQTYVPAKTSHSFSSIPLEGDNGADFGGLATEICQTKMLAEKDPIKAETTCNSFGLAIKCIYQGLPYEKYVSLAKASKLILADGTTLSPDPVKLETYTKLAADFKSKPDILIEKQD